MKLNNPVYQVFLKKKTKKALLFAVMMF